MDIIISAVRRHQRYAEELLPWAIIREIFISLFGLFQTKVKTKLCGDFD